MSAEGATPHPELHFPVDYAAARERFRLAAQGAGAVIDAHPLRARSATDDELSIDVAYLGPQQPDAVLVVSSGLHGVEGFAGSAIQHRLLSVQWAGLMLPPDCGLLLPHALNPHGFSWLRRVNESNADLNRNFVAHPQGHVDNPDYDVLYDAINPPTLDEEADAPRRALLLEYAREHGFAQLQAVLTRGQYRHPRGVQFGGQQVEQSNAILRRIAEHQTRGASRVLWIDIHTGLGPWGEVELISESPPQAPDCLRAQAIWGDAVRSTASGDSVSAAICGSIELGLREALPGRELTAVAAEFGSYDALRVFSAMRADNWLHVHGDAHSERGQAIKRELLEVFRPSDPAWGARVLDVAAGVIARARDWLAV